MLKWSEHGETGGWRWWYLADGARGVGGVGQGHVTATNSLSLVAVAQATSATASARDKLATNIMMFSCFVKRALPHSVFIYIYVPIKSRTPPISSRWGGHCWAFVVFSILHDWLDWIKFTLNYEQDRYNIFPCAQTNRVFVMDRVPPPKLGTQYGLPTAGFQYIQGNVFSW